MAKELYLNSVKEIVNKIDPIGLLKQGAPSDEYESEIQLIVKGLRACSNIEDIQNLTYNIFKDSFGQDMAGNISIYYEIAKNIFDKIKNKPSS